MTIVDLFSDLTLALAAAGAIGLLLAIIGPFIEKIK